MAPPHPTNPHPIEIMKAESWWGATSTDKCSACGQGRAGGQIPRSKRRQIPLAHRGEGSPARTQAHTGRQRMLPQNRTKRKRSREAASENRSTPACAATRYTATLIAQLAAVAAAPCRSPDSP